MSWMRQPVYVWGDEKDVHFLGSDIYGKIPVKVFDELVVMRFAEIVSEGNVKKVEKRAIKKYSGNLGCDELLKKHGLETTQEMLVQQLGNK